MFREKASSIASTPVNAVEIMPLLIKNRNKFPVAVRHIQRLKGISIGGCVDKKNSIGKGYSAHSHCVNDDKFRGWICFHHKWQLNTNSLFHEVAHLLVDTAPSAPRHSKKWFYKFIEIGGDLNRHKYYAHIKRWYPWLMKYIK